MIRSRREGPKLRLLLTAWKRMDYRSGALLTAGKPMEVLAISPFAILRQEPLTMFTAQKPERAPASWRIACRVFSGRRASL